MFEQILERIALALENLRIPYMVIGGQAVLLYGEPRLTRDIDITLGAGPDRLPAIMALIQSWGWTILVSSPAEFVERTMVLPCLEPASGVRVEVACLLTGRKCRPKGWRYAKGAWCGVIP
jgi:hypothetical protein